VTDSLSPVTEFKRGGFLDASETFTRIGSGSLGGKAGGLRLVRDQIIGGLESQRLVEVTVPTLTVLTTEVFDAFMERNDLYKIAFSDRPDDSIAHAFQRAELPAEHVGDLRALISQVHTPLAVRSSSLLEDALKHPFAGIFTTKMIPNNEIEEDQRFLRLVQAIKLVYASTYFRADKAYYAAVGESHESEKMAVIVQEVVGQRANDRFYPCVSVVARSFNYYPRSNARCEEGVVHLALGLGKTIVDGGLSWSFSPAMPKAPPYFKDVGDMLRNTQTSFWAVNMGKPPLPDPIRETEFMVQPDLAAAEADGALKLLVSSFDPGADRFYSGLSGKGPRVLDFAPLLGAPQLGFARLMERLIKLSRQALDTDVEIELAVNLDRNQGLPARVGFLQVRPMLSATDDTVVESAEMTGPDVLTASESVLGHGRLDSLCDVVYLKPEVFDLASTPVIAKQIEEINRGLRDQETSCLLIGFGRWGTTEPWLGVPVDWQQISQARAIVEISLPKVSPDPSLGAHFFQNLLGLGVLYLSVTDAGLGKVDWQWLEQQQVIRETEFVKHVRTPQPLRISVDGKNRRGVVKE
jgi:hypothetical protein